MTEEDANLDMFAGIKKKKKSSKKSIDPTLELDLDASSPSTSAPAEEATGDFDEFADLKKKKKKSKKTTFDMSAFEAEIADSPSSAGGAAGESGGAGGEEEGEGEGEGGEDPFKNEDEEGEGESSKAIKAAERKEWLREGEEGRDYHYTELLGRFYLSLFISHPSLSASGAKKRYTLAPPQMLREGNKKTVFANIVDICKRMHRQPEHVIQFLFAELGTSGSVDGGGRLVLKGRYVQKQIETVLRRYITEYVSCRTCKSPDTLLDKDNRLFFMTCESCGSRRSVQAIKSGFQYVLCLVLSLWNLLGLIAGARRREEEKEEKEEKKEESDKRLTSCSN
ncbi:hypothetical protein T439DRAFT_363737 [Meredithblackwellia eburnea MCA 4105]